MSGCIFSGEYHDEVWGTPVTDADKLFAQLSLCTQQCGISWRIVWNKRHFYADAFHGFRMDRVAAMTDEELDRLCDKEGPWGGKLIQNRAKLAAIIHNAKQCAAIEAAEEGGLSGFLWSFVRGHPETVNAFADCASAEYDRIFGQTSQYSDALAAAIKTKSGYHFKFLGSIVLQAFLLQNGLLNGHAISCFKNPRSSVSRAVERGCPDRTVKAEKRRHAIPGAEPVAMRASGWRRTAKNVSARPDVVSQAAREVVATVPCGDAMLLLPEKTRVEEAGRATLQ